MKARNMHDKAVFLLLLNTFQVFQGQYSRTGTQTIQISERLFPYRPFEQFVLCCLTLPGKKSWKHCPMAFAGVHTNGAMGPWTGGDRARAKHA